MKNKSFIIPLFFLLAVSSCVVPQNGTESSNNSLDNQTSIIESSTIKESVSPSDANYYYEYDELDTTTTGEYARFRNINLDSSYLGYGYDIINDPYIKKDYINKSAPILDKQKLNNASLMLEKENNSNYFEISANSSESFTEKFNTSLKVYGKYGKAFSGGMQLDFSTTTEKTTYLKLYKSMYCVNSFNLYLTDNVKTMQQMLSNDFIEDIESMTAMDIFDKYGTHMIKEVVMGGRLEINYTYTSTTQGYSTEVEADVNMHMGLSKAASLNLEAALDIQNKLSKQDIKSEYRGTQCGGKLIDTSTMERASSNYQTWLSSFDEDLSYSALSGIVGEHSLVPIWDLLPEEYADKKVELSEKFNVLAGENLEEITNLWSVNAKRTLAVNKIGDGEIIGNNSPYIDGDVYSLTAVPAEHFTFKGWYLGDELIENTSTISNKIHVNTNLTAKFEEEEKFFINTYVVGSGYVEGVNDYFYKGDKVNLTAKPNEFNNFIGWYENDSLITTNPVLSFTISKDRELVAKFEEEEKFKLAVSVTGEGTVSGNVGLYYNGSNVHLIAKPKTGYQFDGWYDGDTMVSTETEFIFIITGPQNLVAKFIEIPKQQFSIYVTSLNGVVEGTQEIYLEGDNVAFVAKPYEGYHFVGWYIDSECVCETATYSFVVNKTMNIEARYAINTYEVKFYGWDDVLIAEVEVEHGAKASAPSAPERSGYTFTGWSENIEFVTQSMEVKAIYEKTTFVVTFVDYDGSILHTQKVIVGNDATAPSNPTRNGYEFTGWDKSYTNVKEDLTVTATYRKEATVVSGSFSSPKSFTPTSDTIYISVSVGQARFSYSSFEPMGIPSVTEGVMDQSFSIYQNGTMIFTTTSSTTTSVLVTPNVECKVYVNYFNERVTVQGEIHSIVGPTQYYLSGSYSIRYY